MTPYLRITFRLHAPGFWRETLRSLRSANAGVVACAWFGPFEVGLKSETP